MKKSFQLILILFILFSSIGQAQLITVDAEKDDFYNTLSGPDEGYLILQAFTHNDNGRPHGNQDLSAEVWTAWDTTWIYLYMEVTDDIVKMTGEYAWQNDCIELKVDGVPDDSTQGISFETRLTALDSADVSEEQKAVTDQMNTLADSVKQYARKLTAGGYVLELAIQWSAFGGTEPINAEIDNVFGLAIGISDNDDNSRSASISWAAVLLDAIWNTPKYHGTVKLLADHKLQFIPTNNMTGKTNSLPYDGSVPDLGVIDGEMDPFYSLLSGPDDGFLQIKSYAFNETGVPHGDLDFSATVWCAWDSVWFYLYAEVQDDTISCENSSDAGRNDCIELYIDGQPDDSTQESVPQRARLTILGAGDNPKGITDSLSAYYGDANVKYVRKFERVRDRWSSGNWTLEMAIKLDTLGGSEKIDAAVGGVFGLGMGMNLNL
jgi:hypothetical protein